MDTAHRRARLLLVDDDNTSDGQTPPTGFAFEVPLPASLARFTYMGERVSTIDGVQAPQIHGSNCMDRREIGNYPETDLESPKPTSEPLGSPWANFWIARYLGAGLPPLASHPPRMS